MREPNIISFYHADTGSYSYLVYDHDGGHGCLIDPVLDFDSTLRVTSTEFIEQILDVIRSRQLILDVILETHAHADHLSAAFYAQQQLGGRIAISERIGAVQAHFAPIFGLSPQQYEQAFDLYLHDGEQLTVGDLTIDVMAVPGHTPACLAYRINDIHVFVGDTLFMPDIGTARADFPGGDAHILFHSLQRILSLPNDTILYMCHDYPPPYRKAQYTCTVLDQKERNIHIHHGITESIFTHMRHQRDKTLSAPRLLWHALQVNICGGRVPSRFIFPSSFL